LDRLSVAWFLLTFQARTSFPNTRIYVSHKHEPIPTPHPHARSHRPPALCLDTDHENHLPKDNLHRNHTAVSPQSSLTLLTIAVMFVTRANTSSSGNTNPAGDLAQ
jgi:hypothetical protein